MRIIVKIISILGADIAVCVAIRVTVDVPIKQAAADARH